MPSFNEHLQKVLRFLEEHKSLVDSHLVDFVTENLWDKCLPELLRTELEILISDSVNIDYWYGNDSATPELSKFLNEIDSLSLNKCDFVYHAKDLPELFSTWGLQIEDIDLKSIGGRLDFMNEKKSYEVEIVAKVVSSLAKIHSCAVIDAGAGKGYLSEYISDKYGIPVLAIDSSEVTHKSAIRRQNIIRRKSTQTPNLVHHLAQWIDDSTDFPELAKTHFPAEKLSGYLTITGLHTCGSLGPSVIKSFLETDCIKSLCLVTCCYHLAETSLNEELNFSKNARMLAQQSVERMRENKHCLSPTLHYRAVLQVLLKSLGFCDVRVGRGAPSTDFITYAKWALKKIGLQSEQIPSENLMQELYSSHECFKSKMELYQNLRVRVGAVVESAILLDRIIFLKASNVCSNFALVQLFDPLISPRCYGIIAIK